MVVAVATVQIEVAYCFGEQNFLCLQLSILSFGWKVARKNWVENGGWVSQPTVSVSQTDWFLVSHLPLISVVTMAKLISLEF